jgi:hypothetical protein
LIDTLANFKASRDSSTSRLQKTVTRFTTQLAHGHRAPTPSPGMAPAAPYRDPARHDPTGPPADPASRRKDAKLDIRQHLKRLLADQSETVAGRQFQRSSMQGSPKVAIIGLPATLNRFPFSASESLYNQTPVLPCGRGLGSLLWFADDTSDLGEEEEPAAAGINTQGASSEKRRVV